MWQAQHCFGKLREWQFKVFYLQDWHEKHMEIHKAFQEKFSPDVLVEKTLPLPVYYGNVCLRKAEQLFPSLNLATRERFTGLINNNPFNIK